MATTPDEWLIDIADAYIDAWTAIPFGIFVGESIAESDLFQVAPQVCLKFRGMDQSRSNVGKATEAMLLSYTATQVRDEEMFCDPQIAFAFAYLASHFGMDLLSGSQVSDIMEFIGGHQIELAMAIEERKSAFQTG
jgi:hypothetical protein